MADAQFVINVCFSAVLVCLVGLISYMQIKRPSQNWFTRIAAIELITALCMRFLLGLAFLVLETKHSPQLTDYRYLVPFYMVIKVQLAVIFGWITLNSALQMIRRHDFFMEDILEYREKVIRIAFAGSSLVFWILIVA